MRDVSSRGTFKQVGGEGDGVTINNVFPIIYLNQACNILQKSVEIVMT